MWNTYLKKKLINTSEAVGHGHQTETSKDSSTSYSASPSPSSSSCISYGDLNLDKGGPGEDQDQDQDQEGQESNTFDPSPTTVSPSSTGQHKSNVDGAKLSVNTNANANDDDSPLQTSSVTKEITTGGDEIIEIPFPLESDAGIWSMFDESFDPKGESNFVAQSPESYEVLPRSSLREGHEEEELEYQKWLRYLENELGLLGGTDSDPALKGEDQQQQQQQQQLELVTRGTEKDDQMILRPEPDLDDHDDDDDMAYFPMWPSSPQNFDF